MRVRRELEQESIFLGGVVLIDLTLSIFCRRFVYGPARDTGACSSRAGAGVSVVLIDLTLSIFCRRFVYGPARDTGACSSRAGAGVV